MFLTDSKNILLYFFIFIIKIIRQIGIEIFTQELK